MDAKLLARDEIALVRQHDLIRVREAIRGHVKRLGFGLVDQTKVVTAASELARNMLQYAGGGVVTIEQLESGRHRGVRVTFADRGPGIVDVDLAMKDGYTTGGGLGLGLPGSKRLVDEFVLDSKAGRGTRVQVVKWTR